MAKYDPKSRRPTPAHDPPPATVDEILAAPEREPEREPELEPELEASADPVTAAPERGAEVVDLRLDTVEQAPVTVVVEQSAAEPVSPPDRRLLRMIALGGVVASALALFVVWRRSQRCS